MSTESGGNSRGIDAVQEYNTYISQKAEKSGETSISKKRLVVLTGSNEVECWDWEKVGLWDKFKALVGWGYSVDFKEVAKTVLSIKQKDTPDEGQIYQTFAKNLKVYNSLKETEVCLPFLFSKKWQMIDKDTIDQIELRGKVKVVQQNDLALDTLTKKVGSITYKKQAEPKKNPIDTVFEIPNDKDLENSAWDRVVSIRERIAQDTETFERMIMSAPDDKKASLETSRALRSHKEEQSRPESLTVQARIKLGKTDVSEKEVALLAGKSIAEFRFMKIQEASAKMSISPVNKNDIAENLGITEATLADWLISYEKEFLLREALAHLSTVPSGQLQSLRISFFLENLQNNIDGFTRPLDVVKLFSLRQNMDSLATNESEKITKQIDLILTTMIQNMSRQRKSSLLALTEGGAAPEGLREVVASHLFCAKKDFGWKDLKEGKEAIKGIQAQSVDLQVQTIGNEAQKTLKVIQEIQASGSIKTEYERRKVELPQSIQELCNFEMNSGDISKIFPILEQKLQNIIDRQSKRLEMLEDGKGVQLPLFFHASNDENAIFSMTFSAVRPSHATYYGAFTSTYPGMLRYGGIVVGLSERSAFSSDLSIMTRGPKFPVLLPDSLPGLVQGFADSKREKWVGFEQQVGINPYAHQVKEEFLEGLSFALRKSYISICNSRGIAVTVEDFAQIESQMLNALEKKKMMFSFNSKKKQWEAMVEERFQEGSQMKSRYVPLDGQKLEAMFKDFKFKFIGVKVVLNKDNFFLKNIKEVLPELKTDGGFSVPGKSAGIPLRPYFINIDEDESVKEYFSSQDLWPKGSALGGKPLATPSLDSLKQRYKTEIGYDALVKRAKEGSDSASKNAAQELLKEVDGFLATHFVPLLEQLIEFDFMSKETVLLRPEWLEEQV